MSVLVASGQDRAGESARTGLNFDLFDLLVCPVDKHDLRLEDSSLVCSDCGRRYAIEDGIPNMLVEDATHPSQA